MEMCNIFKNYTQLQAHSSRKFPMEDDDEGAFEISGESDWTARFL